MKPLYQMIVALLVGCGSEPVHMIPVPTAAPDNVRQACILASHKCTGCHDVERVMSAHHDAHEWQVTVDRMRMIPGGAISEADSSVIMSCLIYVAVPPEDKAPAEGPAPAAAPATTPAPAPAAPAAPASPAGSAG
jgi:hypothetical protein